MSTASTKISAGQNEEAIAAVTELLERLKGSKPSSQVELMTIIESIKEVYKPTKESAIKLFKSIEEKFPHESLGGDKWYLVVVSVQEMILRLLLTPESFPP